MSAAASTPVPAVPFLKWAGGKRQLLSELREHVPVEFGTYFEPFVGGGALFFDLFAAGRIRARANLGDSNSELIITYEGVRDKVEDVVRILRTHKDKHGEAHYYATRDRPEAAVAQVAARMIYLNRTCFNGLYRVNRSGKFNVPIGRYANPTICDEDNLRACSLALRVVRLSCSGFSESVSAARRGDFVYFDPPYVPVSETSDFTAFTSGGFTMSDQVHLVDCARRLKGRGVHVLLSNANLPAVREIYKGFETRVVRARRNINSKGGKRGKVGELIIW
jgi:DNA adenine methylase